MAGKGPPRENAKGRRPAESAYLATVGSTNYHYLSSTVKVRCLGVQPIKKLG